MTRARRVKRASATQLYQTCKAAGTCPQDVINKIEHSTVADKILQYGSAAVFLGGLGIGTGPGRGGAVGYRPLGGGSALGTAVRGGTGAGTRVVRPPVIIDTVGPSSVLPVEYWDPAIVPLVDASDVSVTITETVSEVPYLTPPVPPGGAGGHPIVTAESTESAIIELAPKPSLPGRSSVAHTLHSNPAFEVSVNSSNAYGETSGSTNIVVTHSSEGVSVGSREWIPLQEFPRTSTPRPEEPAVAGARKRGGYPARFLERVQVADTAFIHNPGKLVTFDFENPAFEESLQFPLGTEEVRAAPNPDFRDIVYLSRPTFSQTQEGNVRVSRFGRRGTVATRSGTRIGSQVLYTHDISAISAPESIELSVLGEHSETAVTVQDGGDAGDFVIVHSDGESGDFETISLTSTPSLESGHTSQLEDDVTPVIQGQLVIGTQKRSFPSLEINIKGPLSYFGSDYHSKGVVVGPPAVDRPPPRASNRPAAPVQPAEGGGYSYTYYLHPSLRHKKRRRRHMTVVVF
nr:MAG: L2 protein [Leptonychotes weddellii papillomavirus 10]